MTASKVVQISKEIEDARCKGNWKLIPELARRYKKHNPKGESKFFLPFLTASTLYNLYLCFWVSLFYYYAVLAQTISAEASLSQLSINVRKSNSQQQQRLDTNNEEQPYLPPRLDPKQVKPLQLQLESVIRMNGDSETNEKEVYLCKIRRVRRKEGS